MLDTKVLRIVIEEDEKIMIEKDAYNMGFSNLSEYIRFKVIRKEILKSRIKKILNLIGDKDGLD